MNRPRVRLFALAVLALSLWTAGPGAPPLSAQEDAPLVSSAEIASRILILAARTDLDEALRKRASDTYAQAQSELSHEADFQTRAQKAAQRLEAAPRELEEAKAKLAALERPSLPNTAAGSLNDAEAGLSAARRAVIEARGRSEALRRELDQRSERRRTLLERQTALQALLQNLRPIASAPLPTSQPGLSEQILARAQVVAGQAEALAVDRELAADAARADLVAAQSVLATRELAHAEDLVKTWEDVVVKRRREQAAEQAKQARLLQEAARTSPQLSTVADETRKLAERRLGKEGLNARRLATESALKGHQTRIRQLRAGFARLRRRVEAGVPSQTLGILLRRQLEALPSANSLREERASLAGPLARLQADLVELEERREAVGDTERLLAKLALPPGEERATFEEVARDILEKRRENLAALVSEHQAHLDDLLELDHVLSNLTLAESELRSYAEERILWIPSVQDSLVPGAQDFQSGLAWLSDFQAIKAELDAQARPSPLILSLLAALILAFLSSLVWSRRGPPAPTEGSLNAAAWKGALRRISPVVALCGLAFVIGNSLGGGAHALAIGATLRTLSLYSAALTVVWGISPFAGGVALRRLIWISAAPFLAASALVAAMEHAPDLDWTNALGRSAFVAAMLIEAAVLAWALRERGPLGAALRLHEGIVGRLAPYLPYLAAGLPLATAALAAGGYYYTGLRLEIRFEGTLLAVLLALFTYDVLLAALAAPAEAALPVSGESLYKAADSASAINVPSGLIAASAGPELGGAQPPSDPSSPATPDPDGGARDPDQGSLNPDPDPAPFDPPSAPLPPDPDPEVHGQGDVPPEALEVTLPPLTSEIASEAPPSEASPSALPEPSTRSSAAGLSPAQASEVAAALGLAKSDSPPANAPASGQGDVPGDGPELSPEQVSEHLVGLASQARDTVRVVVSLSLVLALAALWADVLPALRRLRDLQLYPQVQVVDASRSARYPALEELGLSQKDATPRSGQPGGTAPAPPPALSPMSPSAGSKGDTESEPLVVTAADLGLALLLILVTLALVRNLPGALEFALIGRLPLDAGARYAATTIARYLVVFIGFGAAAQAVGIGWGRIQWLAAALTFGLAFGLQEIFANFISGLIILFERPVRVGDIVTLGDVTGKVTRVRMRATTITDWNRKELIIPNKELVTGRVINWTLTEAVTRTVIPIGIAYGSDVEQARELILEAARAQAEVMTDPEPSCWFEAFGDSVYELQLRIWLPEPKHIPSARHGILDRIRHAFDAAQIEIAFPQRDLHIRSIEPVIRFKQEGKK